MLSLRLAASLVTLSLLFYAGQAQLPSLSLCLGAEQRILTFYEHIRPGSQTAIIGNTALSPPYTTGYGFTFNNKLTSTPSFAAPEIGRAGGEAFVPQAGTLTSFSYFLRFTAGINAGSELVGGGLFDVAPNTTNDVPVLGGTNTFNYAAGNQAITVVSSSAEGTISVLKHVVTITVYSLDDACFTLL